MRLFLVLRPLVVVLVLLISIAVGILVGLVGSLLSHPAYSSVSQVLWDPTTSRYADPEAYAPDSGSLGVQVQAQRLRITSDEVIDTAAKKLGAQPRTVMSAVTVTGDPDSGAITVTGTASSPVAAQQLTSSVVDAYIAASKSDFSIVFGRRASALQTAIGSLTDELQGERSGSPLAQGLGSQIADLRAQQALLLAQAERPQSPAEVLVRAGITTSPSSPSAATLAVLGGLAGLFIGFFVLGVLYWYRAVYTRAHGPSRRSSAG